VWGILDNRFNKTRAASGYLFKLPPILVQAREDYVSAKKAKDEAKVSPDRPIADFDVTKRVVDILAKAEITTAGDVLEKLKEGDEAILAIDGFGRKSLADIKKAMRRIGYTLPEDQE